MAGAAATLHGRLRERHVDRLGKALRPSTTTIRISGRRGS
jgi:hypothetical protein